MLFLSVGIAGCTTVLPKNTATPQAMEKAPDRIPERLAFNALKPAEGSLWNDNGGASLYVDMRARRTGDTLTVDIVENTSSSMDANTKASRSSDIDASISNNLGYMRALEEANKRLGRDSDGTLSGALFKASMANSFDGKGTSDRSGKVTASVGAVVTEVLPNGNLVISGSREMRVNNETQIINVSGIVRPEDIDTDNRVKSTFIANARIRYTGMGVLADKQRPGWGTRVLDHIWPF